MIEENVALGGMMALSVNVCVFFSPYSQYEHALQQPYLLPSTKNFGVTCTLDNFAI